MGFRAFVWVARPKSSGPQGRKTVREEVKKSFVTRYVWHTQGSYGSAEGPTSWW